MTNSDWFTREYFNRRLDINFAATDDNIKLQRDETVKRLQEHLDVAHAAIMESCTRAYEHHQQIIAQVQPMQQIPELVQETRALCTRLSESMSALPQVTPPIPQLLTHKQLQHITDTLGVVATQCAYIRRMLHEVDLDALPRHPTTIRDLPIECDELPGDPLAGPSRDAAMPIVPEDNFDYYFNISPDKFQRAQTSAYAERAFDERHSTPSRE